MWNLKNQRNKQVKQEQIYRQRKQTGDCQLGGVLGARWKGDRIKMYKLVVTKVVTGCKVQQRGNIVDNLLVTMPGVGWVPDSSGDTL